MSKMIFKLVGALCLGALLTAGCGGATKTKTADKTKTGDKTKTATSKPAD